MNVTLSRSPERSEGASEESPALRAEILTLRVYDIVPSGLRMTDNFVAHN
jgi:hypothetical protein